MDQVTTTLTPTDFCLRGRDYWSLGIKNVASLDKIYQDMAHTFRENLYQDPGYSKTAIKMSWKWR